MLPKQRVAQQYEYTNKNNQAPWPLLLFFPRPTFISAVDDAKVFFSAATHCLQCTGTEEIEVYLRCNNGDVCLSKNAFVP